jgi:hypothetical protein
MKIRKEVWVNGLVEQSSRIHINNPLKGMLHAIKRSKKQEQIEDAVPVTIVWTTIASLFLIGILNYYVIKKAHSPQLPFPPQTPKSDMHHLIQYYELDSRNIYF